MRSKKPESSNDNWVGIASEAVSLLSHLFPALFPKRWCEMNVSFSGKKFLLLFWGVMLSQIGNPTVTGL
jgi:hypothetical protein